MTIAIRRGRAADLGDVLDLAGEYAALAAHGFDALTARRGIGPLLADDTHGVIWVAEADESLVGYAAVTWGWSIEIGGLDVVLDEIYVRRRGTGIGSRLIDHLIADCVERRVRRIFLETEVDNGRARALYERHGFTADSSIWMARALG